MTTQGHQLDLFAQAWVSPPDAETGIGNSPRLDPAALNDAALIRALPNARLSDAPVLAAETARRRLAAAIPALEALCRRFIGFGVHRALVEQVAALEALGQIGGPDAAAAVARILADGVVQSPGLPYGTAAAVRLGARVPIDLALGFLRHPNPVVRADGCRLIRRSTEAVPVLLDLLCDLQQEVADAAACALGRLGRDEARTLLLRQLAQVPSAEAIDALACIADDDDAVRLGRLALTHPALAPSVLDALDAIETPRATTVARGVRRRLAGLEEK